MNETKQVIVFRKDLLKGENAIRKGKFGAQCAHASLAALLTYFSKYEHDFYDSPNLKECCEYNVVFDKNSILDNWLNGTFTKICVSVDNDEELLKIKKQCDEAHIPNALITDAGLTEFHGVPTNTCLGIGPFWSEEIDKITKNLKLL